jgi:hypothetical protein
VKTVNCNLLCRARADPAASPRKKRQAQAIQRMDASDDAYCRKQADSTVTYDQCRKNLMQLRHTAMAGASAGTVDLGSSMKEAGASPQALSPPPAAPTVGKSTPSAGGVRTTCQ